MKKLLENETSTKQLILFNFITHLAWKLDEQCISQMLPSIQSDLDISTLTAQWFSTAFFLASAASAIPLGKIGEKFGQPLLVQICFLVYGVSQIITFFIHNFYVLIVLRVITGISIAGAICNKNGMITRFPPREDSGKSISASVLINNINSVYIPFICGIVDDKIGWRYMYVSSGAVAFLAFLVTFQFKNNPQKTSKKFDLFGSLTLTGAIGSFCAIFVLIASKKYYEMLGCIFSFVGFIVGFIFIEKRVEDPVLPFYLLKNPVSDLLIVYTINYVSVGGVLWIYPQVMELLQVSASTVGIVNMISGLGLVAMSILIPIVQKKIVNRWQINFFNLSSILFVIAMIPLIYNFYGFSVVFSFLNVLFMSVMIVVYKQLLLSVPQKFASRVSGFPTTGRTMGNSISLALFSSVQAISEELIGVEKGKKASFQVCGICIIILTMFQIFLVSFRVGNGAEEAGKKGFKSKQIRALKLEQEEEPLIDPESNVEVSSTVQ